MGGSRGLKCNPPDDGCLAAAETTRQPAGEVAGTTATNQ
nr:MAG TPA: hypothetical protein [Caudoviricetes sp.]